MMKGELRLENITTKHAGSYMCHVQLVNEAGTLITEKHSLSARVEVYF